MNILKTGKLLAVGGLLGTASMLSSGSAHAWYQWYHFYPKGDDFGVGPVGAGYHWYGYDESEEFNEPSGRHRTSVGAQSFYVQAHAWSDSIEPISIYAEGRGLQNTLDGATSYGTTVYADARVMGSQVFYDNAANRACGTDTTCTSFDKTLSQTLIGISPFDVWVGPVKVTVSGNISAYLHAGVGAKGWGTNFLKRADYFIGQGSANLATGAYVQANFRGDASFLGLAGIYVTPSLRLIDVELSPNASSMQVISSAGPTISWQNQLPFRLSTLAGSVDVGATVIGLDLGSVNVGTWDGWTVYQQNIVDDKGSVKL